MRLTTSAAGIYSRSSDWSPDGEFLAFESNRDGVSALYSITKMGLNPTRITHMSGYSGHPAWSPDGDEIVFESTLTGISEIYTVPAVGGEEFKVTDNGGYWPDYSPDGSKVVYCSYGASEPNLWDVVADW